MYIYAPTQYKHVMRWFLSKIFSPCLLTFSFFSVCSWVWRTVSKRDSDVSCSRHGDTFLVILKLHCLVTKQSSQSSVADHWLILSPGTSGTVSMMQSSLIKSARFITQKKGYLSPLVAQVNNFLMWSEESKKIFQTVKIISVSQLRHSRWCWSCCYRVWTRRICWSYQGSSAWHEDSVCWEECYSGRNLSQCWLYPQQGSA